MKIIIRHRNKNIETVNLTSKEEMVWINPDVYSQITTDAAEAAIKFMEKYPQIHEVKFSVLPQMDDEEDEEEFNAQPVTEEEGARASLKEANAGAAGEGEHKPKVIIVGEEQLQEKIDHYASKYPDDHWTMEQIKERLATDEQATEGMEFGDAVSLKEPDTCHTFKCVCITPDVAVYEYKGISKC